MASSMISGICVLVEGNKPGGTLHILYGIQHHSLRGAYHGNYFGYVYDVEGINTEVVEVSDILMAPPAAAGTDTVYQQLALF